MNPAQIISFGLRKQKYSWTIELQQRLTGSSQHREAHHAQRLPETSSTSTASKLTADPYWWLQRRAQAVDWKRQKQRRRDGPTPRASDVSSVEPTVIIDKRLLRRRKWDLSQETCVSSQSQPLPSWMLPYRVLEPFSHHAIFSRHKCLPAKLTWIWIVCSAVQSALQQQSNNSDRQPACTVHGALNKYWTSAGQSCSFMMTITTSQGQSIINISILNSALPSCTCVQVAMEALLCETWRCDLISSSRRPPVTPSAERRWGWTWRMEDFWLFTINSLRINQLHQFQDLLLLFPTYFNIIN